MGKIFERFRAAFNCAKKKLPAQKYSEFTDRYIEIHTWLCLDSIESMPSLDVLRKHCTALYFCGYLDSDFMFAEYSDL